MHKIQSVYCHVHSVGKQVSLYNEIIYLLSTLNAKTSTNYVKKSKQTYTYIKQTS